MDPAAADDDDLPIFHDSHDLFVDLTPPASFSSLRRRPRLRNRIPSLDPITTSDLTSDLTSSTPPAGDPHEPLITNLILKTLSFHIFLLTFPFSLLSNPRAATARAVDLLLSSLAHARAEAERRGLGDLAVRVALGLFWSGLVGFVLLGGLLMAFVVGGLVMRGIVEEPLRIEGELVFDYTMESPVAVVQLVPSVFEHEDAGGRRRVVPVGRRMELMVSMALPESDYNQVLGVFQVRADILSSSGKILASASHPCMLQFKSSLVRFLQTLLKSGLLLAGYTSETQTITIKMKDFVEKTDPTTSIRITIQSRAEFQHGTGLPEIYAASLVLESELPLFKSILWSWRRTLFIWISLGLFMNELFIILLCCRPLIIPNTTMRRAS